MLENLIKSFFDIVISAGPTIVGVLALVYSYRMNSKLIRESERIKELEHENEYKQKIQYFDRNEVYKRLNDFYAPLQLLRRTSKELHNIFKNGKEFRTLPHLLKDGKLDKNSNQILEEIIKVGDECRHIIISNSGLIDNKELRENHLPKLLTHYFLIKQANCGLISNELERFKGYEFPNEIDDILDLKVDDLYRQLEVLNSVN